jgi:aminoglycoside phosphotransferase (APT) family kinase protein
VVVQEAARLRVGIIMQGNDNNQLLINTELVRHLVATQFPQWKDLAIRPVTNDGWDNRTFHLGEHMLVRMPSAERYAGQVEKEHLWLPRLAPMLPLPIPVPLAMGEPADGYPWNWSIYRWIEGESAFFARINNMEQFAMSLAQFLSTLERIDSAGGPLPGLQNFYRGGDLAIYDAEARQAIAALKHKIDANAATEVWQAALAATWHGSPVWIHGDVSTGNLLVQDGQLTAVIDFGLLAVGDPACDLPIAWTLFEGESRRIFRSMMKLDPDTWVRGRAWALWKALNTAIDLKGPSNAEAKKCWRIIDELLADHRNEKLL